jgi:hypothetical protein
MLLKEAIGMADIENWIKIASSCALIYFAWKFGKIQADIAKIQARTARNKLRLDLFEKRLAVHEVIRLHIAAVIEDTTGMLSHDEFFLNKSAANWLFDASVNEWIHGELMPLVAAKQAADLKWKGTHGDNLLSAVVELTSARTELYNQKDKLNNIFAPFLRLED